MSSPFALTTRRPAAVDALRAHRVSALTQLATVVLFAMLTALGAQVRIYLWEVPVTLQTIFVYGGGLCLGARNGFLSILLYVALGLVLPIYSGDGYGISYWLTAVSAGYLLGMPLAALVAGRLSRRWNSVTGSLVSLIGGSLVLFTCGVVWLHYAADHASWMESLDKGFLRFAVIDAAKILCVVLLYQLVRRFR